MSVINAINGFVGLDFLLSYFENPAMLYLIIPAIILIFLSMKAKKRPNLKTKELNKLNRLRKFILIFRLIIFALLIIALAVPIIPIEKNSAGQAYLKILVDNSSSMQVFDLARQYKMINTLSEIVSTELIYVSQGQRPQLGNDILNNIKPGENLLLLTDGNAYSGAELGDVASQISKINSTINALKLNAQKQDFAISITGPSRTVANVNTEFTINVHSSLNDKTINTAVYIDDELKFTEKINGKKTFTHKFTKGTHQIRAKINEVDYFPENNEYYKTITTVKNPKILFVTLQTSPFEKLLENIYDLDIRDSIPSDLSEYHAIIINNIPASQFSTTDINLLTQYTVDENGIFFIGGKASFDRGAYKDNQIENILPVFVSSASKREGEINVIIVMDISGSAGYKFGKGDKVDVEKSLATSIFKDLAFDNRVGVIAFNHESHIVSELDYKLNTPDVVQKIAAVKTSGGTRIELGLIHASQMLENAQGSKNIILISDGVSYMLPIRTAIKNAVEKGMKIYTIGVGENTRDENMEEIARLGNGIYFSADESSKMKLIFGDPEETKTDGNYFDITILNSNHFITKGLKPKAQISGYNQVVPKDTAKMLITTSSGNPILTTWRYGLGRVATYTTDDGTFYASEMLKKENSAAIIRTINWLIGNPLKNEKEYIYTKDTQIGIPTTITIKSKTKPKFDLPTYAKGKNIYLLDYTPQKVGIINVAGSKLASNYPAEYQNTGMNPELENIVKSTGGQMYSKNDVQKIAQEVKSKSTKTQIENKRMSWPLLLLATIIFLLDITTRRIFKK